MVMSKREQMIGIFLCIVLGGAGLYQFVYVPLDAGETELRTQIATERKALVADRKMISEKPNNLAKWNRLLDVLKRDQSEAQSQIVGNVLDWFDNSRLIPTQITPAAAATPVMKWGGKGNEKEKAFMKVTVRLGGSGGMQQLGNFIWQIQSSSIPVRITDLTINSQKQDGRDDQLELGMGLSTIFLTPDGVAGTPARAPASQPQANETGGRRGRGRGDNSTTGPSTQQFGGGRRGNRFQQEEAPTTGSTAAAPASAPATGEVRQ